MVERVGLMERMQIQSIRKVHFNIYLSYSDLCPSFLSHLTSIILWIKL